MDKIAKTSVLFDIYGGLLTDKKRKTMELYNEDNLSLAEIADEFGISRSAVYDSIRSTENTLLGYEEKLGLLNSFERRTKLSEMLLSRMSDIRSAVNRGESGERITEILDGMEELLGKLED